MNFLRGVSAAGGEGALLQRVDSVIFAKDYWMLGGYYGRHGSEENPNFDLAAYIAEGFEKLYPGLADQYQGDDEVTQAA